MTRYKIIIEVETDEIFNDIYDALEGCQIFDSGFEGTLTQSEIRELDKDGKEIELKEYEVNIDYPPECINVKATSKEDAEDKALEMLGDVTINASKQCTAEAELIE